MTKEKDISQLKAVYEKYSANVPESLSSQFPDRPSKPEAVHHHIARTQKETSKFYPSGIFKHHEKDLLFQHVFMYIAEIHALLLWLLLIMPNVLPLADSFVGNCLVYVIIPQKCISKSDSIQGLQNSA